MTEFDKLLKEYSSKSRTIKRTERYPRDIIFNRDFLDALESEYFRKYSGGNRNYHSNFLKAISFELDKFKNNPELISRYKPEIPESEVTVLDIPDADKLPTLDKIG